MYFHHHRPLTRSAKWIMVLIGLLPIIYGGFGVYRDWQFAGNDLGHVMGARANSGLPDLAYWLSPLRRGFGRYHVNCTYTVDGKTWAVTLPVDQKSQRLLSYISTVPIKYLKSSPDVCRVDYDSVDGYLQMQHWWTILIGIVVMLTGPGVGLLQAFQRVEDQAHERRSSDF